MAKKKVKRNKKKFDSEKKEEKMELNSGNCVVVSI